METRPYVSWDLVGSFMVDAFQAAGIPEADAKICADVLMESDRRGIEVMEPIVLNLSILIASMMAS